MEDDKKVDPKIGATVAMIRKSKNLKLWEVTGGDFSESQLARFEKGFTDITVSKFLEILENVHVDLDEFQNIYTEYAVNKGLLFQRELAEAYPKRDIKKIKEILSYWNEESAEKPKNKFLKINQIVVKVVLAMAQGSKPVKEEIAFLLDYLDSVSDWGRYETWIFGNCVRFF